jgi:hypothetical protein
MKSEEMLTQLSELVDDFQNHIMQTDWSELSHKGFIVVLKRSRKDLHGLRLFLEDLREQLKADGVEAELDLGRLIEDYKNAERVLERNIDFEVKKAKHAALRDEELGLELEKPELYAFLQEKALALPMKTRFFIERMQLYLREHKIKRREKLKSPLELLAEKQRELEELREKYERIRSKTILGVMQEETIAELEEEVKRQAMKLTEFRKDLDGTLNEYYKGFQNFERAYHGLRQRVATVEDALQRYIELTGELVAMLKKERDMAKHLVLEIEGETAKLRRAYANELLEFEKNKMLAHKEAEARYVSQIEKLEKELEDARNLIAHFRKLVAEREARIEQLEHMLNIAKHAKHVKSTEGKEKQPKKARHKKRRVKK